MTPRAEWVPPDSALAEVIDAAAGSAIAPDCIDARMLREAVGAAGIVGDAECLRWHMESLRAELFARGFARCRGGKWLVTEDGKIWRATGKDMEVRDER